MSADLDAFRVVLEDYFRKILPDPRMAPAISKDVLNLLWREHRGERIPMIWNVERDSRVLEMLGKGVPAARIAERLEIHRDTVYAIRDKAKGTGEAA